MMVGCAALREYVVYSSGVSWSSSSRLSSRALDGVDVVREMRAQGNKRSLCDHVDHLFHVTPYV